MGKFIRLFCLFFIILNFISFDNKKAHNIYLNDIDNNKAVFLILPRPFYYNYLFQIISINILLSKINSELATIFTFNQKHQMSYVLQKYLSFSDFRLTLINDFKNSKKKEVFDKFFKEELRSLVLRPSIPLQNVWLSKFKFPQKFIDALEHSGLVVKFAFTCVDCVFVGNIFGVTKSLTLIATNVKSFATRNSFFWIEELLNETK